MAKMVKCQVSISTCAMWTMDLERFKEGKAKLSYVGRPKTARGWRLWVAGGLCATCEAKIDDSSHQLLLLLHTGHKLWCSPRLAPGHQLVLEQGGPWCTSVLVCVWTAAVSSAAEPRTSSTHLLTH